MLRLYLHDAAGSTSRFWQKTGDWLPVSNSSSVITIGSEILSGPHAGETIHRKWFGSFDTRTGETYEVDRLQIWVSGDLHQSVRFDDGFSNTEPEWSDAYQAGIAYFGNRHANALLEAGDGDDRLFGGGGRDRLEGYKGDDLLDGGAGRDVMRGGVGDDVYVVDHGGDRVVENAHDGADRAQASVDCALAFGVEELTLTGGKAIDGAGNELGNVILGNRADNRLAGGRGDDTLQGNGGGDSILGQDGGDRLDGNGGSDVLNGGDGDDRLRGGAGRDAYEGGAGADVFIFGSGREASKGSRRDAIMDFAPGQGDKIDVSGIDADETRGGDQDFAWIGADRFSGAAGELRYKDETVAGDLDGDGVRDFQIEMVASAAPSAIDFLL